MFEEEGFTKVSSLFQPFLPRSPQSRTHGLEGASRSFYLFLEGDFVTLPLGLSYC